MDSTSTVTSPLGVQKIGKSMSPKLPKVKDATVNVRDRLNDVLINEKYILNGYNTGSHEMIDQGLLNLVFQNMDRNIRIHRQILEEMFNLGEYQADIATPPQVADTFDVFNGYKTQLPYPQQ